MRDDGQFLLSQQMAVRDKAGTIYQFWAFLFHLFVLKKSKSNSSFLTVCEHYKRFMDFKTWNV